LIILDENILEGQRLLLQAWRVAARQVGFDLGRKGLKDEEILVLLRRQRNPTFFTRDGDFYHPNLRHPSYCLVVASVGQNEVAPSFADSYATPTSTLWSSGWAGSFGSRMSASRSGGCGRKQRCARSGTGPSSVGRRFGVRGGRFAESGKYRQRA